MTPVVCDAPAKLNLSLHVVGRRADGYHLLDSLVAFTELGDTIEATPSDRLTLAIDGPYGPTLGAANDENLVLRAARLLADHLARPPRAALRLTKRLPVASGIGGGSSDAAATLKALTTLWEAPLDDATLARLALRLGADVPVCLLGVPARLTGIGDQLTPLPPLPAAPVVLVNPNRALPTPAVFKARGGPFGATLDDATLTAPIDAAALAAWLRPLANGLTDAAIGLLPEIAEILTALAAAPGSLLARMSGSGATCFALFAKDTDAEAAAAAIGNRHPGWWAAATRLRGQRS